MRLARNGYGLVLYTADGQQVASYGGGEPAWLGDDKFVAYKHPAQASITSHTDIEAILGDARDGSVTDTTFPCCNPIGNGSGAAVVFWFPPHPGSSLERPQFSVWSDGNSTDPLPGFPFEWTAWSPAGDKLIIQHPFGSNPPPGPEGWVEVLAWPGLNSIYEGDHNKSTGSVAFDPSGAYLAYQNPLEPAQPNHVNDVDIATLATRAVSAIPIQGDQFSFAWNANSQLIVSDVVAGTLATYATDGTRVDSQVLDQATAYGTKVTSSTDGSTVLLERFDRSTYDNDRLTVERDGRTTILPALPSDSSNLVAYLSPNGDRLIVTTAGGAWLIKVA